MTRRPRYSVVVPAKDAGNYLADALTSLTRQVDDAREIQVVVIDDGSVDDTATVARRFRERLPGLELIENSSPVGLASARNQGLRACQGRWLAYLDADDWMAPGRLPAMVRAAESLGCAWVRTDHTTVAGRDRRLVRACEPLRDRPLKPTDSILPPEVATMVDYPYAWAGVFDTSLAEDGLLAFDDGLHTAEDRPWIWNLHLNGPSYGVVDAPTLCYRRGVAGSLTQVFDRRQLDFVRAFERVGDVLAGHAQCATFLPKYVRTVMSITAHHLVRVHQAVQAPELTGQTEQVPPAERAEQARTAETALELEPELHAASSRLLSTLPPDLVHEQMSGLTEERAAVLSHVLPAADQVLAGAGGASR
ncbi:glycosyltransferase [Isoptericola sp. S6320L]|uniref:glycosyltransferase family 2 protein n=1 Tax=Isoptericola sp. S6320L TaxID=2926411 RepID=UPI001FF1CC34|nr:glycosyltransferase family 2 protein [Isoptericola sp. S6320L]MCK0117829.1 glycosyltransferase [Isoptericola sp. S6320L]